MASIDMCVNRREISIKPHNRVVEIERHADGSMSIEYADGRRGILPAEDEEMQAFVVYSIIAEL